MIKYSRSRRPFPFKIFYVCMILLIIFGGILLTLLEFLRQIPTSNIANDTLTDAIVVLTGGSYRLEEGLNLLAQRRAKKLFISGVYRGVEVSRLLTLFQGNPKELICCVKLGYTAASTQGNAAETKAWLKNEGYKSLRLVTASYHMPRSIKEFQYQMPNVTVIPHPVFPKQFKRDDWWRWPGTANLILTEYFKYIISSLRLFLGKIFFDRI